MACPSINVGCKAQAMSRLDETFRLMMSSNRHYCMERKFRTTPSIHSYVRNYKAYTTELESIN